MDSPYRNALFTYSGKKEEKLYQNYPFRVQSKPFFVPFRPSDMINYADIL